MKKLVILVLSIVIFASCQQDAMDVPLAKDEIISGVGGVRVIDGVLAFKNSDDLFNATNLVGNMSTSEYKSWQNTLNFKSQYSDFTEILAKNNVDFTKLERYSSVFMNEESKMLEMNNVNTNYSKITDPNGLVIVGDSTYQFSASEIRGIKGYDKEKLKYLLTSRDSELAALGILQSKVTELSVPHRNARVAPWQKDQTGNTVTNIDDKDGTFYVKARLKAVTYAIPPSVQLRQSIDLTATFYRKALFSEEVSYTPQKIEATWSFQIFGAACGVCVPGLINKTGSYNESGESTIAKTIYDTVAYENITNMNLPVSASAYNGDGDTKTSLTTFLFTE